MGCWSVGRVAYDAVGNLAVPMCLSLAAWELTELRHGLPTGAKLIKEQLTL